MSKPPRPILKLVTPEAFTSPYLLQRVRSIEEVLADRQRRIEAEQQAARHGGERKSIEQTAGQR